MTPDSPRQPRSARPAAAPRSSGPPGSRRRRPAAPVPIAAIDIGATAVRMQVAELAAASASPAILENLVHPLALGNDTFRYGHIRPETLRALTRVLAGFARLARDEYGVADADLRCIGTSAVREASNQEMVVDRIAHDTGLTIDVIDPVEESRLAYQMLAPALGDVFVDPKRFSLVLILGGGVTDLMMLEGLDLAYASSRRLGTARLMFSAWPEARGGAQDTTQAIVRNIVNSALDLYRNYPVGQVVMIHAGMAHAARLVAGAVLRDHGATLSPAAARDLAESRLSRPTAALAELLGLRLAEAELLEPAFAILQRTLEIMPGCPWTFAELDTISSLLHEIASERRGENPRQAYARQIYRSAQTLAQRYRIERSHAENVKDNALLLFHELADFLDLGPADLTLLTVAAILHDIGMFVSEQAYHKHSAYLVRWSEIVGLDEMERVIASQIVRYHRRAVPSHSHDEFMALMPAQRLQVRKLAALLRIAHALDHTHRQNVRVVRTVEGERELIIEVAAAAADLAAERAALAELGNLFEQVTGLSLRLRPVAGQ